VAQREDVTWRGAGAARRTGRPRSRSDRAGGCQPPDALGAAGIAGHRRRAGRRRRGAGGGADRRRPGVLLHGILSPVVRASYTKEQILELVRLANLVYDALETLPRSVIAALNGPPPRGRGRALAGLRHPAGRGARHLSRCPRRCGRRSRRRRTGAPADARRPGAGAGDHLHRARAGRDGDGAPRPGAGRPSGPIASCEAQRLAARIAASGPLATRPPSGS